MNRRGFLTALAAAPVAAVMAPSVATPAFAVGGYIKPQYGYIVGQATGESILPLNTARQFQAIFEQSFGASDANTAIFDANADYCDELVEVADA